MDTAPLDETDGPVNGNKKKKGKKVKRDKNE